MRLLVVGQSERTALGRREDAMSRGRQGRHVETLRGRHAHALRAGQGADLLMVDYELDIAGLIAAQRGRAHPRAGGGLRRRHRRQAPPAPPSAPAPANSSRCRPEAELIAAVLAAVADDTGRWSSRDPAMQRGDHAGRPDRAARRRRS